MAEIFYRNLPHLHLPNATYFITIRLAGSLPLDALAKMREEYEQQEQLLKAHLQGRALAEERYKLQKKFFARYDQMLDAAKHGPRWLAEPRVAEIVVHEIQALHPEYYHLQAYCLMSNHVHLAIDQQGIPEPPPRKDGKRYTALSRAMRQLKSKSGYACLQQIGKHGDFWQHESYDHVVRNEREFERIIAYIIENPVKAGLVKEWQQWPYTYLNPELL